MKQTMIRMRSILQGKGDRKMKEAIIGLVILAYIIPFAYMFIANIADVSKRLFEVVNTRVKPAVVLITKSMID
jgi:hypothetical protein